MTLDGVQSTAENLEAAKAGENYEFTEMYPGFLADAQEEENEAAQKTFGGGLKVEETHYGLYSQASEAIGNGSDLEDKLIWVCPICGQTFYGEAPENCDVCGCSSSKFLEIQ